MTADDILRMAREADPFGDDGRLVSLAMLTPGTLERFAGLVAAAEREACAQIVEKNAALCVTNREIHDVLHANAVAIRARGGGSVMQRHRIRIERSPPWTPAQVALLGTMPDAEVARLTGRARTAVRRARYYRGIAAYNPPRRAAPGKQEVQAKGKAAV